MFKCAKGEPLSLYPPQQKGGNKETLFNTCITHTNRADMLLSNNSSELLSGDIDNKNQLKVSLVMTTSID